MDASTDAQCKRLEDSVGGPMVIIILFKNNKYVTHVKDTSTKHLDEIRKQTRWRFS